MNILVTGSKGFIGSELCQYLRELKHNVFECDRKDNKEVLNITLEYLSFYKIDIIVHLAAQTSVWNSDISLIESDNITAFLHIYKLAKQLNIKFIYASSSCSINVTSMYGLTKQFTDKFVELYPYEKCVGLRFHNVYGKQARENTLLGICKNNYTITLYNNGLNRRHFTYIEDVCKSIVKAFDLPSGLYNIVNPIETTVIDFVSLVKQYKPNLYVICVDEIRDRDKEIQHIDNTHINLIEDNYTSLEDGLKKCFENE